MQRKLLIVTCLLTLSIVVYGQKKKKSNKQQETTTQIQGFKEIGAKLPPVRYYRRDGVYITNADLNNDAPLIIMLFNPTCEHCEEQARLFQQHLSSFKETKLLLMAAPAMGPYLGYFVKNTQSDKYPSLQIGLDSSDYIQNTFRYETLPQINVYDAQHTLVRVFNGSTPIDSLKPYIR